MLNNKDKMHPQDMRNLIIFGVISIALWTMFEIYVLQPKKEAMQKRQHIERLIAKKEAETGQEIVSKPKVLPREDVLAQGKRVSFDNGSIYGTISLKGGRVDDLSLSKYFTTLEKKDHVILLAPRDTAHPRFIDFGWVAESKSTRVPDADTQWRVEGNDKLTPDTPVKLVWDNGQGLTFERVFTLDQHYVFKIDQSVRNATAADVVLFPYSLITQTGIPDHLVHREQMMHEGPTGFVGNELWQATYGNMNKDTRRERLADEGWVGITDKYWLTSIIPPQGQTMKYRYSYLPNIKDADMGRYQVDFTGGAVTIPAGSSAGSTSHLFAGAKEVLVLDKYMEELNAPKFNLAVDFGWFWFMTQPFFYILHWLYVHIGNMGISIILLTILIRTLVFPLTNTSYRSFAKMKKVTPQIMELRNKHGADKKKLQEEIVELYSREGVNPMAGCLPILIQIPIFFSLYKVFFVTIEMRHAPFFGWIQDLSAPDPTSVFNLFGLIPYDPPSFLMIGVWPCLMLVGQLIQKELNPPPQDKMQRDMMRFFPFFITYLMSGFASGLVVYWTFSAYIGILQQMIIMKSLGVPIYMFNRSAIDKQMNQQIEKGPDIHPLAEMVEEDLEQALFGEKDEDAPAVTPPKPKKSKKKK